MTILDTLHSSRLFFDGGTGTVLQSWGLAPGERPESWNLTQPQRITALHRAYLEAGANIIKTNTFGVNELRFPGQTQALVAAALDCAEAAAAGARAEGRPVYIALDLGPSGKLLQPLGDLAFEDAVALFAQVIRAGDGRADCILIETMNDAYETKAAVLAAKENASLPIFVTNVYDDSGRLMTGADPETMVALLEGLGVTALGMNCSLGPAQMEALLPRFLAAASVPVIVNPNAGLPREEEGRAVYDVGPDDFAASMRRMAELGASLLGGCCGTTPDYIRALREAVGELPPAPVTHKDRCVVSSGSRAVLLEGATVLIGERINPTGKKRLRQALLDDDADYLLRLASEQEDAGAQILDLNVGLPELDEAAVLCRMTQAVQEITALPIQLDSARPAALERAMRLYNGKPMVNSVSGKAASLAAVLPLVRHYGGVLVCLLLDDDGIPATVEGRLAVAGNILRAAEAAGIDRRDLIFDPLAMTVSAQPDGALVTLECVRRLHAMGLRSTLGVSNISFGLPRREKVTAAFFAMAIREGLSAAIMNPLSTAMTDAWYSACVLCGYDEHCSRYLAAMQDRPDEAPASPAKQPELGAAIERGLREAAAAAAREALAQGKSPLELISGAVVPALDRVGSAFEAKQLYLPQLLMSAEAASEAFAVLRTKLAESNRAPAGEKIVLATVRGDIHDIGKNIVKVLLENYGFTVLDLGKDVPPETVLQAVLAQKIRLVGLSALMTTTVPAMAETIALLREQAPGTTVVVGGAVLTPAYAARIGADFYAKDAMQTVRFAERFFGR